MAREFILTGAPGAGKTLIVRALEAGGIDIVEEAATDVIALWQGRGVDEAWRSPDFIEAIAKLQVQRLARPAAGPVRVESCTTASPAAASPGTPEMNSRSPGRAPDRVSQRSGSIQPPTWTVMTSGPRTVSPPTSATP